MMKKKILGICLLILAIGLLFYPFTLLEIREGIGGGELIYQTFTETGDFFSLKWVHSVSKQPVVETYEINKDYTIGIYEMIFNENGPNLPHGPEGGTKWEIKDGVFRVYNYNLVFDAVPVRIGQVIANHTLVYKDKELELKDISKPGGFVRIRATRVPFIQYLYKEVQLWLKTR